MKKKLDFLSENFQFLVVKFSVYLNRRVFVMTVVYHCLFRRVVVELNKMIIKNARMPYASSCCVVRF